MTEAQEATNNLTIPAISGYPGMSDLLVGEPVCLDDMRYRNTRPSAKPHRWLGDKVRHTVLGLLMEERSGQCVVVESEGASPGQLAPPQGPINPKDNIYDALQRVVFDETGIIIDPGSCTYIASCLLEVDSKSSKAGTFSHQFFHILCTTIPQGHASWSEVDVNGHQPTTLHHRCMLDTLATTMRPAKLRMLQQAMRLF